MTLSSKGGHAADPTWLRVPPGGTNDARPKQPLFSTGRHALPISEPSMLSHEIFGAVPTVAVSGSPGSSLSGTERLYPAEQTLLFADSVICPLHTKAHKGWVSPCCVGLFLQPPAPALPTSLRNGSWAATRVLRFFPRRRTPALCRVARWASKLSRSCSLP